MLKWNKPLFYWFKQNSSKSSVESFSEFCRSDVGRDINEAGSVDDEVDATFANERAPDVDGSDDDAEVDATFANERTPDEDGSDDAGVAVWAL